MEKFKAHPTKPIRPPRLFYEHSGDVIASGSGSAWFLSTVHRCAKMYKVFCGLIKKPHVFFTIFASAEQWRIGLRCTRADNFTLVSCHIPSLRRSPGSWCGSSHAQTSNSQLYNHWLKTIERYGSQHPWSCVFWCGFVSCDCCCSHGWSSSAISLNPSA